MLDLSKSMWNLALQPLKNISTSTMLMVNKLGRIMGYSKIMWQTKTILFPIPQDQYHQTWQDGDLPWAAYTHKVTQPFGHIVFIREVFPENFSFIDQFNLTLQLFKVFGIVQKFPFCKFPWFSGTPTFR